MSRKKNKKPKTALDSTGQETPSQEDQSSDECSINSDSLENKPHFLTRLLWPIQNYPKSVILLSLPIVVIPNYWSPIEDFRLMIKINAGIVAAIIILVIAVHDIQPSGDDY